MSNVQRIGWMFTINYQQGDGSKWGFFKRLPELPDFSVHPNVRYAIYQEEQGGNTACYHLQGYIEFVRSVRMSTVIGVLPPGAHVDPRYGSQAQAIAYCSKRDDTYLAGPYVYGTPSLGQGTSVDLDQLYKDIKADKPLLELVENHFSSFIRHHTGVMKAISLLEQPRTTKPIVKWFFGPPGTGKTYSAHLEGQRLYNHPHSQWHDGYTGEDVVLLDDFCGYIPFNELLQFLDRYDYRAQVKGGFNRPKPRKIIICSNYLPHQIYKDSKLPWAALERRVDKWLFFWDTKLEQVVHMYTKYEDFLDRVLRFNFPEVPTDQIKYLTM